MNPGRSVNVSLLLHNKLTKIGIKVSNEIIPTLPICTGEVQVREPDVGFFVTLDPEINCYGEMVIVGARRARTMRSRKVGERKKTEGRTRRN
jgi:hypothetical protein